MPRNKKAARKPNHYATPKGVRHGGHNLETPFVPFDSTSSPRDGTKGFTLQEEARNTERHNSFWNTDQRLRDSKVSFVSAGNLESTEPKDTESALANMSLDSPKHEDEETDETRDILKASTPNPLGAIQANSSNENGNPDTSSSTENQISSSSNFIVDTEGGQLVQTGLPPPRLRSTSLVSDSSEEIILFAGRDQQGRALSRPPGSSGASTNLIDTKIKIVEQEIHKQEAFLEEVLHQKELLPQPAPSPPAEISDVELEVERPINLDQQDRVSYSGRRIRKNKKKTEEEELIADYIANISTEDEGLLHSFGQRDLGATDEEIWVETEASSEPAHRERAREHSSWNRSDINDFDDMSTSDEVMGDVQAILSKRDRESGIQYLVVWENQSVDEARWVPATALTSISALFHIKKFEAEEKLVAEMEDYDNNDMSDSDELGIDDDADNDEDDDDDLRRRKTVHMSDEQIARLLAKQEELGMGSAELLLFDDEAEEDVDEELIRKTAFNPIVRPSKMSRIKGQNDKRAKGDFPSAHLLADAYDGFDIMDFDRPSLKKPKGRRGKPAFDLSDSELEASMGMAWENDRLKKKERKQEREELRSQGLLGNKNAKANLKERYKEGMTIGAVKEEIKSFLMSRNTTLSLPPMDKADRKIVHELANAFNLKSKSAGSGKNRFPVLYRTSRTSIYDERTFDAVEARLSRRFLPRMDVSSKKSGSGSKRTGGGFNNAAVSYRDGDIVGGSAPELGVENKGRAMLEKMGWSSGTALGALNNKGILQPVSHVVKTTKAGLG